MWQRQQSDIETTIASGRYSGAIVNVSYSYHERIDSLTGEREVAIENIVSVEPLSPTLKELFGERIDFDALAAEERRRIYNEIVAREDGWRVVNS